MTMSMRDPSRPSARSLSGTDDADFNWPPTDEELAQFQLARPERTTADTRAGDDAVGSAETLAAPRAPATVEETAPLLACFEDEPLTASEASRILNESSFVAIPDGNTAFEQRISDGVQRSEPSPTRRGRVTPAATALAIRALVAAVGVVVGVMLAVWLRLGVMTRESGAPVTRWSEAPAPHGLPPADPPISNPAPTLPIVTPPGAGLERLAPRQAESVPSAAPVQIGPLRPSAAGQGGVTEPSATATASAPAEVSAPSQLLPPQLLPPQLLPRATIDPIPVSVPPRPEAPGPEPASPAAAPEGPPAIEPGANPTVPAAGVVDDRSAIQQVLQRYQRAYAALDARATAAVWPSVDERALQKAFTLLQSQDLVFHRCDVAITGLRATAQCSGELRYVPRVGKATVRTQPHAWTFQLDRVGEDWRITSVTGR
jgi:hypothetical protein